MHLPSDAAKLCSCKNEGYVAVPATQKRVDERSTRDFALAIAGIGDSCSGYAGFPVLAALCGAAVCFSFSLSF